MDVCAIGARRRVLIAALALCTPFSSQSQTPRIYRIGFLVPRASGMFENRIEAFRAAMRELGYAEGKNLIIDWRFADGDYKRLPALARDLVQSKIDVLVVDSTPGVKAAQAATTTLPIVMVSVGDPIGSGVVASLARPGENITGLSNVVPDLSAKYVELLHLAVPGVSRIAVLTNSDNAWHRKMAGQIEAAARTIGVTTSSVAVRTPAEIDAAFAAIRKERANALIVLGDPFFGQQSRQIADLALASGVATVATNRALAEAGSLMSYGQDLTEHYRRAATYVDKILKGAKPRDLPVEQPTKIELVINMKTGKALGLKLPQPLLLRADSVIE